MWLNGIVPIVLLSGLSVEEFAGKNVMNSLRPELNQTGNATTQKRKSSRRGFDVVQVDFSEGPNKLPSGIFNRMNDDSEPYSATKNKSSESVIINFQWQEFANQLELSHRPRNREPVFIEFNINEVTPLSRIQQSNDTSSYEDDYSSEYTDSDTITSHSPLGSQPLPIECKYGTDENPYPVINIKRSGRRVSEIKCEEFSWRLKHEIIDADYYRNECMKKTITSGIIGGKNSNQGDFPHMAALGWLRKDGRPPVTFCGSSLISTRYAITAAHCKSLRRRTDLVAKYNLKFAVPKVVIVGSVRLNKVYEHYKEVNIGSFLVPPEYKPPMLYNDIALVRLEKEIPLTRHARPACLWFGAPLQSYGNITGWGQTEEDDIDSGHTLLQHAQVDFIDRDHCRNLTETATNRNWQHGLDDSQFCAGVLKGGVDSCQGDSGGPIQVQNPVFDSDYYMYHVVGIISFGNKCARPNQPGIYTNVTSFLCWIEETVWPEEPNMRCRR